MGAPQTHLYLILWYITWLLGLYSLVANLAQKDAVICKKFWPNNLMSPVGTAHYGVVKYVQAYFSTSIKWKHGNFR